MSKTIQELRQAIVDGDDELASQKAEAALIEGLAPMDVMQQGAVCGIEDSSRIWNDGRYFFPDMLLSAGALTAALEVIQPKLVETSGQRKGHIVLGVVAGDQHDLGKMIVTAALSGAGYEVIDLGVDVPDQTFVDKVRQLKPDILGLGTSLTTTMPRMKAVIDSLKAAGLRLQVKVVIGGVPTSQKFAEEIGADAWGKDALDAVAKAGILLSLHQG